MEDKFVYMTVDQVEVRKAKVAAIEGLADIRAAIDATKYVVGDLDKTRDHLRDLDEMRAAFPRAAAYLEAERWIATENPVKVRLGSRAMEKILNGEDPEAVIQEMSKGLDAFYLAQQGD
jgi:hypothetical protein